MPKPKIANDPRRRTMWLSDALWGRMIRAAKKDDRTISAWLRRVVEKALK